MRCLNVRNNPIWVHDDEDLSNHIIRENDYYEAEILDYIRDTFNKQKVILDIGANIGNHSLYFSRYLEYSHIYAFEPIPANFEVLSKNISNLDNITLFPKALANKKQILRMSLHKRNWGIGRVDPLGTIKVPAITLDSLKLDNISLIKIDVENWEPQVLMGAKKTLKINKSLILIEDNYNIYSEFFPNHRLLKEWEIYRTYLYGPKE